jgi:hypothetical protein
MKPPRTPHVRNNLIPLSVRRLLLGTRHLGLRGQLLPSRASPFPDGVTATSGKQRWVHWRWVCPKFVRLDVSSVGSAFRRLLDLGQGFSRGRSWAGSKAIPVQKTLGRTGLKSESTVRRRGCILSAIVRRGHFNMNQRLLICPHIFLCSGGTNIGTCNTLLWEIPAHLRPGGSQLQRSLPGTGDLPAIDGSAEGDYSRREGIRAGAGANTALLRNCVCIRCYARPTQ